MNIFPKQMTFFFCKNFFGGTYTTQIMAAYVLIFIPWKISFGITTTETTTHQNICLSELFFMKSIVFRGVLRKLSICRRNAIKMFLLFDLDGIH